MRPAGCRPGWFYVQIELAENPGHGRARVAFDFDGRMNLFLAETVNDRNPFCAYDFPRLLATVVEHHEIVQQVESSRVVDAVFGLQSPPQALCGSRCRLRLRVSPQNFQFEKLHFVQEVGARSRPLVARDAMPPSPVTASPPVAAPWTWLRRSAR